MLFPVTLVMSGTDFFLDKRMGETIEKFREREKKSFLHLVLLPVSPNINKLYSGDATTVPSSSISEAQAIR